jgi:hypothetical protein
VKIPKQSPQLNEHNKKDNLGPVLGDAQECGMVFMMTSLFLLAIVLSVLLQFTDSDYPFDIFKLFLT